MRRDPARSCDASHFQRLYDAKADPWEFRTSPYEQAKFRRTVGLLGPRRFRSGFEAGCSIGVLTRLLAPRCDALLAVDIVAAPLVAARAACADMPWVRFEQMRIPLAWPEGRFDLIVLSEVLYFLSRADIESVAARVMASLAEDGVVLLANWRGRSDDPCTGDEAAETFQQSTKTGLVVVNGHQEPRYRLDLLARG